MTEPTIPTAVRSPYDGNVGLNPSRSSPAAGGFIVKFQKKQTAMTPTKHTKKNSKLRIPKMWRQRKVKVSRTVMMHPAQRGNLNSMFKAIAEQTTA